MTVCATELQGVFTNALEGTTGFDDVRAHVMEKPLVEHGAMDRMVQKYLGIQITIR
jgi:hypothetical protein